MADSVPYVDRNAVTQRLPVVLERRVSARVIGLGIAVACVVVAVLVIATW